MEYKFKLLLPLYFAAIQFVYFVWHFPRKTFWRYRIYLLSGFLSAFLFFIITIIMLFLIGWLPPLVEFFAVLVIYMVTSIIPYWIIYKFSKIDQGPHNWLGVINLCWLSIMGLAISLLILFYREGILGGPLPETCLPKDYYQSVIQQCNFFLNAITNSVSVLGAGLGVCMAILWSGEWRNQPEQYRDHINSSMKIIFAFFGIVVAAIIWGALPLHQQIVALQEMLK